MLFLLSILASHSSRDIRENAQWIALLLVLGAVVVFAWRNSWPWGQEVTLPWLERLTSVVTSWRIGNSHVRGGRRFLMAQRRSNRPSRSPIRRWHTSIPRRRRIVFIRRRRSPISPSRRTMIISPVLVTGRYSLRRRPTVGHWRRPAVVHAMSPGSSSRRASMVRVMRTILVIGWVRPLTVASTRRSARGRRYS